MSSERSRHSPTTVSGPTPQSAQVMRQPVGPRVQLAVGQRLARSNTTAVASGVRAACASNSSRHGGRPARHARCRSSRAGWSRARSAPRMSRLPTARARVRQPPPPAAASSRARAPPRWPLEQVGGVLNRPAIPPACRPPSRSSVRLSDRSNLALARRNRLEPARPAQPASKRGPRIVLERQHHLEQRVLRQRARRVEHLHQPLERHVLVAVGRQVARAHPPRSARASSGLPERVGAQHQRVDEEADSRPARCRCARRSGCRSAMSLPAPSRVSSAGKAGLQHHEQARPAPARKRDAARRAARARAQAPRAARDSSPPPAAAGRPAAQAAREAGQRLAPVAKLARKRSPARSPAPAHRAATACSRHIAPAAAASCGACPCRRAA